jgi:hypothetical protein
MTPIGPAVIPAGLRRLVAATLFTAAVAVGSSAFGHLAIARADWDIGAYDACMAQPHTGTGAEEQKYHMYCCGMSGGVVTASGGCGAPVNFNGPGQEGTPTETLRPVMTPVMPAPTEALP